MDKLPKPCYGNHDGYYCTYECKYGSECYGVTNVKWGKCDCEFKAHCHIWRQDTTTYFKEEKEDCSFYKMFNKDNLVIIEFPDGIIKMNPIKDEVNKNE